MALGACGKYDWYASSPTPTFCLSLHRPVLGGRAGPHTPQQTSEGQESGLFMLSQNDHIA